MSSREDILKLIKELSVNDIYYMAPSMYVKRGYEYYSQGRVEDIWWQDGSLRLKVRGRRLYNVIAGYGDAKGVNFSCDCPAFMATGSCKHVVCSLITLKNLLDPNVFRAHAPSPEKREVLLELLHGQGRESDSPQEDNIAPEAEDVLPCLIIEPNVDAPFYLEYKGKRDDYPALMQPENYKYLRLKRRLVSGEYTINDLRNIDIPVIYRDRKERILRFDSTLRYRAYTEVVLNKRKTIIKKKVSCTGETAGEGVIVDRLVVHPDSGVFGLVRDTTGWSFFHSVVPSYYHRRVSFTMRDVVDLYHEDDICRDVDFLLRDRKIEPERVEPEYKIMVKIENRLEGRKAILTPVLMVRGTKQSIYPPLMEFFNFVVNGRTRPLRRMECRRILIERLFQLREAMDKRERASMVDNLIKEIKCKREDRRYLQEYIRDYFVKGHKSIYRTLIEKDNVFIYPLEPDRQAGLLEVLYRPFGDHIFRHFEYGSLSIPVDEFERKLGTLYSMARGMGIEVSVQGRPIRVSRWDIAITLGREIDWFELHPEIRVNGRDVSEKVWRAIIEGRAGYLMGKDAIEVMDPETEERLRELSKRLSLQKKSKGREVVRVPRLQILDWLDLRRHGVKVKLPPDDERVLDSLLNFRGIENRPLPSGLRANLRDYQQEGYNWLCFLYEHLLGACLADDMGLGKTLQTISLLSAVKEGLLRGIPEDRPPHLIVVPPSLLFNWESEIKRFYPAMNIYKYTGKDRGDHFDGHDVVLTSYGVVRRDISLLEKRRFNIIVFDEAQAVKNIHAGTTGAVRRLRGHMKIALTGTPLENHIGEYYSIIDLVLPGLLGEYTDFRRHIKGHDEDILNIIIKRTCSFVLRRTKEQVLRELPPKVETDIYLDLTDEQKAVYEKTVRAVRQEVEDAYREKTPAQAGIIAISALLKLRQICLCPALLSDELPPHSPKVDLLIERLHTLLEEGHSALVFSQFTTFLDIVEERLKREGMHYVRLDGSTPVRRRKAVVKRFQEEKDVNIFLLSLRAGGQGLNLTRATYVFHLDPWWNPAVESQATDRSHRIGQKRRVTVFRLLMRHTIEEKIMLLKKRKKALYDAVLGSGVSSRGVKITREDMEFLLG